MKIRLETEEALMRVLRMVPGGGGAGDGERDRRRVVEAVMKSWEVKEGNKVLIARLLELLVVRLWPELVERSGKEVMEERLRR